MCVGNTTTSNPGHFRAMSKGWHIDGLPNEFIKGTTDHYGRIHNFDILVGVLLSDITQMDGMAGELCVWPGSHTKL